MLTLGKFNDIKLQCREQQQQQQQEQEQPRQQHHQQKAQQQQQQEQQQQQRKNNNMLPTLLSAFCVFIFAMSALQVTAAEEEGDSCSMKSIQGQCMAASKCYDRIDHYIREGLLKQDEIKSCGLGPREEIICCPLNVIPTAGTATVATPPTITGTVLTTRPITTAAMLTTTTTTTTTTTARPTQIAVGGKSLDASATHFDFQNIIGSGFGGNKPPKQQVERNLIQNNEERRNAQNVVPFGQAVQTGRGLDLDLGMPQIMANEFFGDNAITNKGFMINNENRDVNTNPSFVADDQTNNNRLRVPTHVGRTQFQPPGQIRNQQRDRQPSGRLIVNGPMMPGDRRRKPDRRGEAQTQNQQQAPIIWPTESKQQQQQQNPTIIWPTNNQQQQQQQQQNGFDPIDYVNKQMINQGLDIVKADLISTKEFSNPSIPSTPTAWNTNGAPVPLETTTVNTNWDSDPFAPFQFQGKPIDEIDDNNIGLDTNNANGNTNGGGGGGGGGGGDQSINDVTNTNANFAFPSAAGVAQPTASSEPSIVRTSKRPSEEACSKLKHDTPHTLTQHILGGTPVDSGEYPHMAAIAYPSTDGVNSYTFRCGGTLIDKRFVLTAAHCVVDDESQPQFVRLGVINLSQSLANDGIDVGIAKVHIHQNYSLSIKYNDVALLELAEEVKFTDFIRPTCLYTELNDPPSSNKYFVSGWGTINQRTRTVSNILLKAELNIVPLASCNISVAEASGGSHRQLMFGVQQTQLCAADSGGKRDACTGDSGGPLIMVNDATSKSYHAVGIVSVGFGCASRTPGLYTRVAAYLDFIESIVWPGQ